MDWLFNTEYLVFSGGGVRGLAFLGAYAVLAHEFSQKGRSLYLQIKGFAGSSAGAFIAVMAAVGCTAKEMEEHCLRIDGYKIIRNLDVLNISDHWGLNDKKEIVDQLRGVLQTQCNSPDLTFRQLEERLGKKLVVTATRVNDGQVEYFSPEHTPDLEIWRGVMSSMSIPILFAPNRIGTSTYIDGGLLDNLPIDVFPLEKTLALLLTRHQPYKISGFRDYLMRVLYLATDAMERQRISSAPPLLRNHIVKIDTGSVSSVEFTITEADKMSMICRGAVIMYQLFHPELLLAQARQSVLNSVLHTMNANLFTDETPPMKDGDKK